MKSLILFLGLILGLSSVAAPHMLGRRATLSLNDKSTIVGVIKSVENGAYTVRTDTVGTVTVQEDTIENIQFDKKEVEKLRQDLAAGKAVLPNLDKKQIQELTGREDAPDVNAIANQILGSDQLMGLVEKLSSDPEMLKVLNDPQLMQAIFEGDLSKLLANEKIMKLMQNTSIQEISDEVISKEKEKPAAE
jgi:hypothetical protein